MTPVCKNHAKSIDSEWFGEYIKDIKWLHH